MLVGVSQNCVYPESATQLPKVGGYSGIDYEKIIRLKPDIVIGIPAIHGVSHKLSSLGIRYEEIKQDSIDDIYRSVIKIGRLLKRNNAAKNALLNLKKDIMNEKISSLGKSKKSVLIVIGNLPGELRNIYIASNKSFLGELIQLAGYENAYSGSIKYPNITAEQVINMKPNIILILNASKILSKKQKDAIIKPWLKIKKYFSVKIEVLNGDFVYIPSPRFINTLRLIKKTLN